MPKKKIHKWSDELDETQTKRLDLRLTATAREWIDSKPFTPATVYERIARGVWVLSGPDLSDDDDE